jgi:hypothetical protein
VQVRESVCGRVDLSPAFARLWLAVERELSRLVKVHHTETLMDAAKTVRRSVTVGVPSSGLVSKICMAPDLVVILAASR